MKINNNQKGFTLVELLAVIVILAILALVAMPNVTGLMEKSRKNAFVTETIEFAKQATTAYTDLQVSGSVTNSPDLYLPTKNFTYGGKAYNYFCISYAKLAKDYISKSNGDSYKGIIEIFMPASTNTDGKTVTLVSITNGKYAVNGVSLTKLAKGNYTEAASGVGTFNSGDTLTYSTCPNGNNAETTLTTRINAIQSGQFD